MIEVEGKIINQLVSILIDSRVIHCYIDPKKVDRLHLENINLENQVWFNYTLEPKEESMIWLEVVP
jgi:hypothetical protein